MLSGEGNEHEVQDDLESCYWVLLYIAFHYFEHNSPDFDLSFFSEYIAPKDKKPASGGRLKRDFFSTYLLRPVVWSCAPLNWLIHNLTLFYHRYTRAAGAIPPRETEEFKMLHEKAGDLNEALELFDYALAREGWPENDAVDD